MPHITRRRYLIAYRDDPVSTDEREFEVRVLVGDIMRAELEAPRYALTTQTHSIAVLMLWCWAAAIRQGDVPSTTTWPDFRERLVDFSKLEDESPDPTPGGTLDVSPSSSLHESAGSTIEAGSTPSSTTLA